MSWLSDLLGGATTGLIPSEITDIYNTPLPQVTAPDISFQPFGVTTSGLGGVSTTATGGTAFNLSPEQQALQNLLFGQAGTMLGQVPTAGASLGTSGNQLLTQGQALLGQTPYGLGSTQAASQQAYGLGSDFMTQAGMPTGAREQTIYERIRAAQTPEEERQRMALEERLFAQGRGGVTTNQYGGTPEQLAMAKAQAEAQNTAMLGAMQQAQREQAQLGALGAQYAGLGSSLTGQSQALTAAQQAQALQAMQGGMGMLQGQTGLQQALQGMGLAGMQAGYAPQSNLLNALQGGLNVASMADVARRQQGEYGLQTQIANMQGALGQQQGLANLYGGVYGGLLGGLGGLVGAAADPLASSFGEWLGGLFD